MLAFFNLCNMIRNLKPASVGLSVGSVIINKCGLPAGLRNFG